MDLPRPLLDAGVIEDLGGKKTGSAFIATALDLAAQLPITVEGGARVAQLAP